MITKSVTILTPQELNHSSYIQTGLFELENEGFLNVKVKISFSKRLGTLKVIDDKIEITNHPHPKTSFYEFEDTVLQKKIKFATDLYDSPHSFSEYALKNCDYIFKRNFEQICVNALSQEYKNKIFPLGLTFKVLSKNKKQSYKFLIGLLGSNFLLSIKLDSYFFKRILNSLKLQLTNWKNYKKATYLDGYKVVNEQTDDYVFFQTRCFSSESQTDVLQIHKQRFDVILLLKKHFKDKFKGGFIPSRIAQEKYMEAVTSLPTDPSSYLSLIKKAKIVVYTRGLLNSPAWKMAEYLCQGKVIVAEKLTAELPKSLTNGKEVLFFEKEEEIPLIIENVINNDELCKSLAKNARNYFEQNVHPKENMKRILSFMLENSK